MKLTNRTKNIIPLLTIMGLLLFQFQNCAKKDFAFEDQKVEETMSFFEYRYTKATPIYFEIQVLPTTADATYQTYDILGFATPSDGSSAALNYKIDIYDVNHNSICAQKVGILAAGETLISDNCVVNKNTKIGSAVIQVKKQTEGVWNVYTKQYNE
ncbi:hypothetical protein CIK05_04565 [Bdellovibrio sp. qaytius]|nr:hypothetical protein CIK05_04565 [Bdellovibrio sp. qaytius]